MYELKRFNSYFLKNSISHRGAILWNAVSTYFAGSQFTAFYRNVFKRRINTLRNLILVYSQFRRFPDNTVILSAISHLFIVLNFLSNNILSKSIVVK